MSSTSNLNLKYIPYKDSMSHEDWWECAKNAVVIIYTHHKFNTYSVFIREDYLTLSNLVDFLKLIPCFNLLLSNTFKFYRLNLADRVYQLSTDYSFSKSDNEGVVKLVLEDDNTPNSIIYCFAHSLNAPLKRVPSKPMSIGDLKGYMVKTENTEVIMPKIELDRRIKAFQVIYTTNDVNGNARQLYFCYDEYYDLIAVYREHSTGQVANELKYKFTEMPKIFTTISEFNRLKTLYDAQIL